MAENRRGKENRFYFSRGQLVLLGGAFVLASIVIFFIGMFVGKGIEERKILKRDDPLVKIPVKPTPQGSSGAPATPPKEEITFNEAVSKLPAAPAVAEERPPEKTANLERKQSKAPEKAETPAVKSPEKKIEKSASGEDSAKSTATETAAPKDTGKLWRAQVNAYPDERSAKQIVDRLKNKGYNAYVTEAQNKGKTWYRVNVGKYGSREEADKVVETLRSKENFTKAFAATK